MTRPCSSQHDRDVLEDNGLADVEDQAAEPQLLHHDEVTAT